MSVAALKDARVEIKTSQTMKEMLNNAASLSGQDLTSFMLSSSEARAKVVLSEYNALSLSRDEQKSFMDAMRAPAKSTKALKELMAMEPLVER